MPGYGMQSAMAAAYQAGDAPAPLGCAEPACGCEGKGGNDCCCSDCCCPGWCHRVNIFGEFLYLQARNAEVAYAVPVQNNNPLPPNAPVPPFVQLGPVEVVDPDYSAGFRGGIGFTLNECSQIVATFTQFDSNTADAAVLPGGGPAVFQPLLVTPGNTAGSFLNAAAALDIQFQLVDLDYKGLIAYNCDYKVNYAVGVRYASLDQEVTAQYTVNNVQNVFSAVEFDGAGLKLGLEGEYYAVNDQWFAYGKAFYSLVGGEFRSRYLMGTNLNPVIADTSLNIGRLVSIYDLEVGVGWRNYCDNFRLSVGYNYSIWTNVMKNNEWINTIQTNNFVDPSDNYDGMITFDGLTARAEILW
jgi:hypothetical protein